MCGIAGVLSTREDVVRSALPPMVEAQRHRGPDDQGVEFLPVGECWLGLGHRRLSILDLSPAGHQPMRHAEFGDLIVFNGEIYNFRRLRQELERDGARFAGCGDTEVLLEGLRRHGDAFLDRLEGMFALAWFDRLNESLLLARDPVGIKPLYLAWRPNALIFASEVRALAASGLIDAKLDRRGVAGVLAYGAVHEPFTIFEGIEAAPGGAAIRIDARRAPQRPPQPAARSWSFPEIDRSISGRDAVERLRSTLEAASADHLISDVPVGVFLSSGLDSTLIATLAARHTDRLRTFTVDFADQPQFSESTLASETARRIGAQHTNLQISGPQALAACAEWLDALDQPSADGLNTYIISKAVRAEGIVVALSGLGGDELLGGYKSFRIVPRAQRHLRRLGWAPGALRRVAARVATAWQPQAVREKAAAMAGGAGDTLSLFLQCRRTLSNGELAALGLRQPPSGLTPEFVPEALLEGVGSDGEDVIAALSRLETRVYMGNMLLRDSDANGMAHSLEIRVPMLDRRMLDLCHAIPGEIRAPHGQPGKHLLRAAFGDLLPASLLEQRKRGFTLPIGQWMVGPLRDLCEQGLRALKATGILAPAAIDAVWTAFAREPGLRRWARPLSLVVLGRYAQRNTR